MNNEYIDEEKLEEINKVFSMEWTETNFYDYTRGHDFFTLFAVICNQYRRKEEKFYQIEACARCNFRISDFVKTNLYYELKKYENKYNLKICSH